MRSMWAETVKGILTDLPKLLNELDKQQSSASEVWDDKIPLDPDEFYQEFGLLQHARTMQPVPHLADFQIRTWKLFLKHKRILEVKSNKIGESTKWLMADFQLALLPPTHPLSCMGFDQLVIAQTKDMAKEHLRTLRRMVIDSRKFNKYLINKPTEIYEDGQLVDMRRIMRDEQTKTSVIYLYNPTKPTRPSRIIALGCENPGSILSWKNVKNIHFSDPTATQGDYSASINSAMTRLANTNGSMIIETVPGEPHGKVFDMWNEARNAGEWKEGDFKLEIVTADEAVEAGIILPEFLVAEKRRLGAQFDQYYNAKFGAITGGVFLPEQIEACQLIPYDPEYPAIKTVVSMGIDPAFGSSKFAFVVCRLLDGKVQVLYADEFDKADFNEMLRKAVELVTSYHIDKAYVDGSNPEYIRALKKLLHERPDYERAMEDADRNKVDYQRFMKVVPVYFNEENQTMLTHAQQLVADGNVAIDKRFASLLTQMRVASTNLKGALEKNDATLDLIDAFFMALKRYAY